jgi:photoactive yellow protein
MEHAQLSQLAYITNADLEPAPFGGVIVDGTGTISLYNAYESALANLSADRVIGKNFFLDVAPCTAVAAFEGRFLEFVASEEPVSDQFAYFFPFKHGSANVLVTFVKRAEPDSYLIVIERVEKERTAPLEDFYSPIVGESLEG